MKKLLLVLAVIAVIGFIGYLARPLKIAPKPAEFSCLDTTKGEQRKINALVNGTIYGLGLTYAAHLEETASSYNPNAAPPVFVKHSRSLLIDGGDVALPSTKALIAAAAEVEPSLAHVLQTSFPNLTAQLDYETELAIVLLEDISPEQLDNPDFAPKLGFTIANDLSARSISVLGEDQPNRYDYWGAGKSFEGFTPVYSQMWVPEKPVRNGLPCVNIESYVNGERRQQQNTRDLIYTPLAMMREIQARYPQRQLREGDIILTGTPGGVGLQVPRWMARLSEIIGMDRFDKLKSLSKRDVFLQPGDEVIVSGNRIGQVAIKVVPERSNNSL